MASGNITTLIDNARSRAAVLSSLDNAFEVKLQDAHKKPLNEVEKSAHSHNDRDAFIDHLQEMLRGTGVYSRQRIEDQVKGKTIVLQHLRSGSTNALAKLKKAHKGYCRASKGKIKQFKTVLPSSIAVEEVEALRSLFSGYLKQLCAGCKNISQLQARLMTCEPTGATVVVVESIDASLRQYIGRSGTIVSESVNCFYIAYESLATDKVVLHGKRSGKKRRRRGDPQTEAPSTAATSLKDECSTEQSEQFRHSEGEPTKPPPSTPASSVSTCPPDLAIVRVIKEKCRLALSIDASFLSFVSGGGGGGRHKRGRDEDSSEQGSTDPPLVCIIHGKQYLPHLESTFHSLPAPV